jgi:hypothetical protein
MRAISACCQNENRLFGTLNAAHENGKNAAQFLLGCAKARPRGYN